MKIYTNRYHDFTPVTRHTGTHNVRFATMATSVHNRSIGENSDAGPMVHGRNRRRIHRTVSCHAGLTRGRPHQNGTSRNYKKVWRPIKMRYSNDRCYSSAPSSPDRALNLELGGAKFDS